MGTEVVGQPNAAAQFRIDHPVLQHSLETEAREIAMRISMLLALATLSTTMAVGLAADDPISERRALMRDMRKAESSVNQLILGRYFPEKAAAAAQTVAENMDAFLALLPEGSHVGETKALPLIWMEMDQFKALAAATIDDARAAQAAATVGQDAFMAAWQPVAASCQSCHERYAPVVLRGY